VSTLKKKLSISFPVVKTGEDMSGSKVFETWPVCFYKARPAITDLEMLPRRGEKSLKTLLIVRAFLW
jgi:hypothetical protein